MQNKVAVHLALFFFSLNVLATASLNWQEVEMEKETRLRIERSLSSLLKEGEFLVETDVVVGNPGGPDFRGLDQIGMKVSDVEFDDSKGDYIAFSKLGLEVPVVEKMHKENQKRLIEIHKFNEAYDLFKNIESVKIDVFLSDLLKDDVVKRAETIVKSLKFSFAEIKPQIQFKKIAMQIPPKKELPKKEEKKEKPKVEKEKKLTLKEILDFISRFGNAIGLITATILFGIFGLWLLRKYFQGLKDLKEQEEADNEEEVPEDLTEESEEESSEVEEDSEQCVVTTPEENFERLRTFVSKHEAESTILFKRWIHDEQKVFADCLKVCVQSFSDNELEKIYSNLTEGDRFTWKSRIDGFIQDEDIEKTCQFIAEEVMRETVSPQSFDDMELFDIVLTLRPKDALSFLEAHETYAPLLLEMLSENFLNRIIEKCNPTQFESLIGMGDSNLGKEITVQELKNKLNEFLSNRHSSNFGKKIISIVDSLDLKKEEVVYKLLASKDMLDELESVAKENFPASLIFHLPNQLMSNLLKNYPTKSLVEFLTSLDEEKSQELTSLYAEEGSTSRDILEMELDQVRNNETFVASINSLKDQYFREFLEYTRGYLDLNEQAKKEIEPIVKRWIEGLKDDGASEQVGAA